MQRENAKPETTNQSVLSSAPDIEMAAIEIWRQTKNDSADWDWNRVNAIRRSAYRRMALAILSAAGCLNGLGNISDTKTTREPEYTREEMREKLGSPLQRYLATDPVPEDFLAVEGDQYPVCPQCGGETGLISRPEEGRAWSCDCGWEGKSYV